jgi:hypothetical protein
MKLLLLLVAAAGCAPLLGLDNTKFLYKDAMTDAPTACDGAPACVATSGRLVCGQMFGTGSTAGQPLRVAAPTGGACTGTEGPCALNLYGQSVASFYVGGSTDRVSGTIDDCGRYVVPLPETEADVAVVFSSAVHLTSASLLLGRMTTVGVDENVPAYPVLLTTATDWGTQLSGTSPPTIDSAYLVTQADGSGVAQATEEVWVDGGPANGPPTTPWSAYFTGDAAFGTLDPAATMTDTSGSSLVVPSGSGSFMLGGKRTGKTCTQIMVQPVGNTIIHVTLAC